MMKFTVDRVYETNRALAASAIATTAAAICE